MSSCSSGRKSDSPRRRKIWSWSKISSEKFQAQVRMNFKKVLIKIILYSYYRILFSHKNEPLLHATWINPKTKDRVKEEKGCILQWLYLYEVQKQTNKKTFMVIQIGYLVIGLMNESRHGRTCQDSGDVLILVWMVVTQSVCMCVCVYKLYV